MLEILSVIVFCWLFFKVMKLALHVAWGGAKIIASLLMAVAVPLLVIGVIFAGGIVLLVPIALIGIGFGLLKAAV